MTAAAQRRLCAIIAPSAASRFVCKKTASDCRHQSGRFGDGTPVLNCLFVVLLMYLVTTPPRMTTRGGTAALPQHRRVQGSAPAAGAEQPPAHLLSIRLQGIPSTSVAVGRDDKSPFRGRRAARPETARCLRPPLTVAPARGSPR